MFRIHRTRAQWLALASILIAFSSTLSAQATKGSIGVFDGQSDVGSVTPAGTLTFDRASGVYTLSSAGANLWSTVDGFHFAWKKMSGDVSLTADMNFPITTGDPNPHRKAILIFRQSLDADSAYVDAAQHGVGMTALQYRNEKGDTTKDIELNIDAPRRLRIEKHGDTFTMFLSNKGEPLHQSGASIKLRLKEPFYVGIGVCSHNKDVVEKATFSNVSLKQLAAPATPPQMALYSTLQTVDIDATAIRQTIVRTIRGRMEAPNWSRDGKQLIFTMDGHLWTVSVDGGEPKMIDTGDLIKCTGSHGLSPDGKWLAASCSTAAMPEARVYVVPAQGGTPRLVTQGPNSYWHSWSPDGKTILFVRPDHGALIDYAIPAEGGDEKAITPLTGLSDDPDYSPDGKYVYFNSNRAGGTMQIWRMKPDGSDPEQITSDDLNSWTPHPSPDGKSILILSYEHSETAHAANKNVALRILSPADKSVRTLINIVGGSGSDNVPNWAPDSQHFAFVSFQMLPDETITPVE